MRFQRFPLQPGNRCDECWNSQLALWTEQDGACRMHLQPLETERLPEACPRKPQGLQISYLHAHSAMASALDQEFPSFSFRVSLCSTSHHARRGSHCSMRKPHRCQIIHMLPSEGPASQLCLCSCDPCRGCGLSVSLKVSTIPAYRGERVSHMYGQYTAREDVIQCLIMSRARPWCIAVWC